MWQPSHTNPGAWIDCFEIKIEVLNQFIAPSGATFTRGVIAGTQDLVNLSLPVGWVGQVTCFSFDLMRIKINNILVDFASDSRQKQIPSNFNLTGTKTTKTEDVQTLHINLAYPLQGILSWSCYTQNPPLAWVVFLLPYFSVSLFTKYSGQIPWAKLMNSFFFSLYLNSLISMSCVKKSPLDNVSQIYP